MRSDSVTRGIARAPHRSLFKALGFIDEELSRPLVGLAVAKSGIALACPLCETSWFSHHRSGF
jgi:dihydroxyacid dehydratase/phosphogluconate dehydratase